MPKDLKWGMRPNIFLATQLAKENISILVYDAINLEGVPMSLAEVQDVLAGATVEGYQISFLRQRKKGES